MTMNISLADIVNSDWFSQVTLTAALKVRGFVPMALAKSGLFTQQGISTRTILVEELKQRVGLMGFADPNGYGDLVQPDKRAATAVPVKAFIGHSNLYAGDIVGKRAYGSDTLEQLAQKAIERTDSVTMGYVLPSHEAMRMGAVLGYIVEPKTLAWTTGSVTCVKNDLSSGSVTIPVLSAYDTDLCTLFGVTRAAPRQFDFSTAGKMSANIKICDSIRDAIVAGLGSATFSGVRVYCGRTLFRKMKSYVDLIQQIAWTGKGEDAPAIKALGPQMTTQFENGIPSIYFQGIEFVEYSYALGYGNTNAVEFIDPNLGVAVPLNVPFKYVEYDASPNWIETVNTPGQPLFARSEVMRQNKGIEILVESHPLFIDHYPKASCHVVSV